VVKRLIIHCGLHKTGSTALQLALSSQAEALYAQNILYPAAGQLKLVGGGHHNIAWEINADRRFFDRYGTLDDLFKEISTFDGTVVLSSEDFESFLGARAKVDRLLAAFASCPAPPVFVIYLRNQLDYSESLFFENLGQGAPDPYAHALAATLESGQFRLNDWVFQFDYRKVLERLASAGATVMVRNFHALTGQSVITDFLQLIGCRQDTLTGETAATPSRRPELRAAIARFYGNGAGRSLNARLIAETIGERKIGTSEGARRRFRDKFPADNLALCAQYGLPADGLDYAKMPDVENRVQDRFSMERIFSERTRELMESMLDVLRPHQPAAAIERARQYFGVSGPAASSGPDAASPIH
jgi:hypothetical protein